MNGPRVGSILTPSHRKLLNSDDNIDTSSARSTRARIRKRLRAGFIDQELILRKLSLKDLQTALERHEGPKSGELSEEGYLDNGLSAAIGIIYLAVLVRCGASIERPSDEMLTDTQFFEKHVNKGIRMALNRLGRSVDDVESSFRISLGQEFEQLEDLKPDVLADYPEDTLLQARLNDHITKDQFMAAMKAKGLTRDDN